MSEIVIYFIGEIIFLCLLIVATIPVIKNYIEDKNPVSIAVIVYIVSIQLIDFLLIILVINQSLDIKFGLGLNLTYVFGLLALAIQVEFLFYLKKLRKFYSIPFIIPFYVGYSLAINQNKTPFIIFASLSGIITMVILIREGRIHKNGIAIGLGLFGFIYGLAEMFSLLPMKSLIRIIGSIILILCTSGFIEKLFILQDKEEQKKISDVWISRKVEIVKK